MLVSELNPGISFIHNNIEYVKVRAKFNEDIVLEVKHEGRTYHVPSQDCAAVNLSNGDFEFIKDEVTPIDWIDDNTL